MKFTKLLSKPSTDFWGLMKYTKLVIDENYEIGRKVDKPSKGYCDVSLRK